MQEEENKPQLYVVVEQEILCRKDLSIMAKLVYARMSGFKEFFESPEKTGEFFGKSASSIIGARQELEKKGLIQCIRNTGRGKVYRVVRLTEIGYSDYQKFSSQTTKNLVTYNKKENKTYSNTIIKDNSIPANSEKALELARYLQSRILKHYPNNVGANKKDCVERWAVDIEKMIRLDKRNIESIKNAIDFAMNDNFWQRNIWSGANLRKHYDRLEADAKSRFLKYGQIIV